MRPRYDLPVYWSPFGHGYDARLTPRGQVFARARMVPELPGFYELTWTYGPKRSRPPRMGINTIEKHVERWLKRHRAALERTVPPPLQVFERRAGPRAAEPSDAGLLCAQVVPSLRKGMGLLPSDREGPCQGLALPIVSRGSLALRAVGFVRPLIEPASTQVQGPLNLSRQGIRDVAAAEDIGSNTYRYAKFVCL